MLDLAYGLGDCSLPWQREALIYLASNPEPDVRALAVALWRSSEPVHLLSGDLVDRLLRHLARSAARCDRGSCHAATLRHVDVRGTCRRRPRSRRSWKPRFAGILAWAELLLALLRTRESTDIRMKSILSPDSEHGKTFIALVDQLIRSSSEKRYQLDSRVTFELSQASGVGPGPGPAVRAAPLPDWRRRSVRHPHRSGVRLRLATLPISRDSSRSLSGAVGG